jgi:hypothetical protein
MTEAGESESPVSPCMRPPSTPSRDLPAANIDSGGGVSERRPKRPPSCRPSKESPPKRETRPAAPWISLPMRPVTPPTGPTSQPTFQTTPATPQTQPPGLGQPYRLPKLGRRSPRMHCRPFRKRLAVPVWNSEHPAAQSLVRRPLDSASPTAPSLSRQITRRIHRSNESRAG